MSDELNPDKTEAPGAERIRGLREDRLHVDPLLDCLVELTRLNGRPSTHAALSAGLPLLNGNLTPSLFARAAARGGFASKVVRRALQKIEDSLLPVVLILHGNNACLLLGWDDAKENARVLLPESGQGLVTLGRDELLQRYTGVAIFARPHFRFDQRTPEVGNPSGRHWFWGAIFEQTPIYKDILVAAALINIFAIAMPLFSMNVYDRVVPNYALETLWMLAAGLLVVFFIDYTLRLARSHFVDLASSRVDLKLSSRIMERVLGMKMADRPASVGAFASTLRSFETVRDFIASATVTALIDVPFALLFFGMILLISWPLVFVPLVGMILGLGYSYLIQHRMYALSETTFRASAMRNAALVESLTALEAIKVHGAEGRMQVKWEQSAAFLSRVSGKMRLLSAAASNGAMELQQVVNVAMIIVGVYLINDGHLTQGGLIACTQLASRAMAPLGQLVALLTQYQGARVALQSLNATMAMPGERQAESALVHRTDIRGEIEFREVVFSYPKADQESLKGVSFRIMPGERVVILGRVGSGKSTLQKLMLGLYTPTSGAVLIDGVDLRQIDPVDLRRSIGYAEQDPMLFYGSLRENIAIGAPYADDRVIVSAADVGCLSEFINRHPKGFDLVIGERGESLSGGQRQGVAIARAVVLDPPILLLDEPSNSMDFSTEVQFKDRISKFAHEKTMVIVTHRMSLLDLADRVIVIDDGKIMADGPKAKVLEALQSGKVGKAS